MTRWRLIYTDLTDGTVLGELPFVDASVNVELNGFGRIDATIPLDTQPQALTLLRSAAEADADDSPAGLWMLDETTGTTMLDISGQRRHGTYRGAVSLAQDGPAPTIQRSVGFSRFAQRAEVAEDQAEAFAFPGREPFTVAFWVLFETLPTSNFVRLVSFESVSNNTGWWVVWHNTLGIRFYRTVGAAFVSANQGSAVATDTWYQVVCTYDGTTLRIYVDGQLKGSATNTTAMPAGTAKLILNANPAGVAAGCRMAAVSIWSEAFDAARVAAMYAAHTGLTPDAAATITRPRALSPETLAPWRSALYLERDGVIVGGGIPVSIAADPQAGTMRLSGGGLFSYLARRTIRTDLTYTGVEQTSIASGLINAHAAGFAAGDIGITAVPTATGVNRDRTYAGAERKPIAEAIQQLAAVENGFDFYVDTNWSAGQLATTMTFGYPATGRHTEHVLEWGRNCVALQVDYDGGAIANLVDAFGAGNGPTQLVRTKSSPALMGPYPLLETQLAYGDVTRTSTLDAHAARRLSRSSGPVRRVSAEVLPDLLPVGSLRVGDIVRVIARRGWLDLDDEFRITAVDLSVGSNGERMQLAPAGLESFEEG